MANNSNTNKEEIVESLYQYLKIQHAFVADYREKILEFGTNAFIKCELYKKEIEKDENKYNQQNLKLIKLDIEKLFKTLNTKMDLAKEQNKKLIQILKAEENAEIKSDNSSSECSINMKLLEIELRELRRIALLTQPNEPLTPHGYQFITSTNAIRPLSSMSSTSVAQSSELDVISFSQKCNKFFV